LRRGQSFAKGTAHSVGGCVYSINLFYIFPPIVIVNITNISSRMYTHRRWVYIQ